MYWVFCAVVIEMSHVNVYCKEVFFNLKVVTRKETRLNNYVGKLDNRLIIIINSTVN